MAIACARALLSLAFVATSALALSLSPRGDARALPARRRTAMTSGACSTTLYDVPVSNNGARVRAILYHKEIASEVDIVSPQALGGLNSPEYRALNPQGKMPLLTYASEEDGELQAIAESDTIARYLLDKYSDVGPSLIGSTLEERTRSDALVRHHDMYITTIQGVMYKPSPPFATFGTRPIALKEMRKQLDVLEDLASGTGPFLAGPTPTLADVSVFPTMIFATHCLPKFDWTTEEVLGPKLSAWFAMYKATPVGARIFDEIMGGLTAWDERGRWDKIRYAGLRDAADSTLFDKILDGSIPSDKVYEDDVCLAFRDINPAAPTHVLIIPKNRAGLTSLHYADKEHQELLGHLMITAGEVARLEGIEEDGFRVVVNDGAKSAQSVFHLHVHVLGGREMTWPPG